jgi:hypothetical protein
VSVAFSRVRCTGDCSRAYKDVWKKCFRKKNENRDALSVCYINLRFTCYRCSLLTGKLTIRTDLALAKTSKQKKYTQNTNYVTEIIHITYGQKLFKSLQGRSYRFIQLINSSRTYYSGISNFPTLFIHGIFSSLIRTRTTDSIIRCYYQFKRIQTTDGCGLIVRLRLSLM